MWGISLKHTIAILIALVCQLSGAHSQEIGMCRSEYLEQPPDQLMCNPYINMELKLECIVSLLTTDPLSGRVTVDWFHSSSLQLTPKAAAENQLAINRLDSAQDNITIREQILVSELHMALRVRSRLEVTKLDEFDTGQYWCGIHIDSTELMVLSDPVLLQHPSEYADLNACSTAVAQSKTERKCATWSFNPSTSPTIPQSTATEFPSATSSVSSPVSTMNASESVSTSKAVDIEFLTEDGLSPEKTEGEIPTSLPPETSNSTNNNGSHAQMTADDQFSTETKPDNKGYLTEFYITVGILVAFGSIIAILVMLVVCMCIKYIKGKRKMDAAEEKGPRIIVQSPSTVATDYLVPISMTEQWLQIHGQPITGDNPVYMADIRQEFTSFWLQKVQERRSEILEHSYESMVHDYEDIFLESLNGGVPNPVLMKTNEAYTIPRTLNRPCHMLPF